LGSQRGSQKKPIMRINQQIALAEFNLHKEIVSVTNDLWFAALKANDALI